jgi:predicted nucleic acid-binding protein
MKNKIYIETSVISHYTAKRSENIRILAHQLSTEEMWNQLSNFDVYISDIVIDEVSKGSLNQSEARLIAIKDFQIIERNDKSSKLANILLSKNALPKQCLDDALHIAIASIHNIDFILTLNFKHINNPYTKTKIRKIIKEEGYRCPVLCSPEELLGENDE